MASTRFSLLLANLTSHPLWLICREGLFLSSVEFGVHIAVLYSWTWVKSMLLKLFSLLFCHQSRLPIYFDLSNAKDKEKSPSKSSIKFGATLNVRWKVSNQKALCVCLLYGEKINQSKSFILRSKETIECPVLLQVAWGPSGLPLSFCREGNEGTKFL